MDIHHPVVAWVGAVVDWVVAPAVAVAAALAAVGMPAAVVVLVKWVYGHKRAVEWKPWQEQEAADTVAVRGVAGTVAVQAAVPAAGTVAAGSIAAVVQAAVAADHRGHMPAAAADHMGPADSIPAVAVVVAADPAVAVRSRMRSRPQAHNCRRRCHRRFAFAELRDTAGAAERYEEALHYRLKPWMKCS